MNITMTRLEKIKPSSFNPSSRTESKRIKYLKESIQIFGFARHDICTGERLYAT